MKKSVKETAFRLYSFKCGFLNKIQALMQSVIDKKNVYLLKSLIILKSVYSINIQKNLKNIPFWYKTVPVDVTVDICKRKLLFLKYIV